MSLDIGGFLDATHGVKSIVEFIFWATKHLVNMFSQWKQRHACHQAMGLSKWLWHTRTHEHKSNSDVCVCAYVHIHSPMVAHVLPHIASIPLLILSSFIFSSISLWNPVLFVIVVGWHQYSTIVWRKLYLECANDSLGWCGWQWYEQNE